MSKQILAAATAAVGLVLLAGVSRALSAADEGPIPPLTVRCYYNGQTCDYSEERYGHWDDCDTTYPHTDIFTVTARSICGKYNEPA